MFRSHISFIVQPAPLIMNEPPNNRANKAGSGKEPAGVARAALHPQGQNNNQVPDKQHINK